MITLKEKKLRKFIKPKFARPKFLGRPNYKSIGYALTDKAHCKNTDPIYALQNAGCDFVFHETSEQTHQIQAAISAMNPGDELVITKLGQLGNKQLEILKKITEMQAEEKHLRTLDGKLNTREIGPLTSILIGLISGITEIGLEENLKRKAIYADKVTIHKRLRGRPKISQAKEDLVIRLRNQGFSYRSIKDQTGLALSTIRRIIVDEQSKGYKSASS